MTRYLANIVAGLLFGYYTYFNIGVEVSFIKLIILTVLLFSVLLLIKHRDNFLKSICTSIIVFGVSFCFGVGYINTVSQKDSHLKSFSGQVVVKDVEYGYDNSKIVVYAEKIDKSFIFNLSSFQKINLIPGDILNISGSLESEVLIAPERNKDSWETFDYGRYLSSRGIDYSLRVDKLEKQVSHETNFNRLGFRLRGFILEKLNNVIPDDRAGLLLAMVLGDDRGLDKDMKDVFKNAGLSHILVFSGFNFVVLIAAFNYFIKSLSKRTTLLLNSVFAMLILLLVPFSAPTARAGAFVSYGLLSNIFNKSYNVKFVLWVFVLVYSIFNPVAAVSDASFHLSVLATFAIVYGGELIDMYTKSNIKAYFCMLLIMFLVTAPYVLYMFGNVSLFSILANAFALPLVSVVTVAGIVLIVLTIVSNFLGIIFGYLVSILIKALILIANFFAPYYISIKYIDISMSFIFIYYFVLILCYSWALFFLKTKNKTI